MSRIRTSGLSTFVAVAIVAGLLLGASPASAAARHAVPAKSAVAPSAKATPSKNLTDSEVVEVSGKGWPHKATLALVECDAAAATNVANACEPAGETTTSNAKGVVAPTPITFATGTLNLDGAACDPGQTCYLVLSDPSVSGLQVLIKVTAKKAVK